MNTTIKPYLVGAAIGALSAAKVDFDAFKAFKSFQDAATYNWGVALWRWFQGAVIGAVGVGVVPFS